MPFKKSIAVLICVIASLCVNASAAPELNDVNYQIESYASYSSEGLGSVYGSGFDGQGNLYVTHLGTADAGYRDGSISQVSPTGVTTRWADNLNKPTRVVWTGGTAYGDSMYVMEYSNDKISVLDNQGNYSNFTTVYHSPVSLALDRYGNFGNQLFAGTTANHGIYSISTSGSLSQLGTFPGTITGGGLRDIEFSPTEKYSGNMFIGMKIYSGSFQYLNGIFSVDTEGDARFFAPSIVSLDDLAFDTVGTQFDNDLFAIGYKDGVAGKHVWRIDESGNATSLALLTGVYAPTLTFGTDGTMYLSTVSDDQTEIFRISEVPEPASLLMLGLGGFLIRRKRKLS